MSANVHIDTHPQLSSVGIICLCGKSVAGIEGIARQCQCGRIWIISAVMIAGPRVEPKEYQEGDPYP